VIVLHAHRLIYIHPPRTAGTSVTRWLSALTAWRDLELGGTDLGEAMQPEFYRRFGLSKHSTYAEAIAVDPALASYRSIGTWRDPLDRVRSIFGFLRGHDAEVEPGWRAVLHTCRDVNDFVTSGFFATDGPDRMFLPLRTWLDGVGTILDVATLDITLPAWLAGHGIPVPPDPLPHLNEAGWPDPTPWRPESEAIVRARYG